MNLIVSKLKEVLSSVLPIIVLVLILNFTLTPLGGTLLVRFLIGCVLITLGLALFLIGVEIGIAPLGSLTGLALAKTNKLWIVLIAGLILGFFISIAEPGLMVLANQVSTVTGGQILSWTLLVVVSLGLAGMLAFGFFRIFYNIPLYRVLLVIYVIIFGLSFFVSKEFLAIAFDSSGSTTGILAVPFILSLSVGISKLKKDSKASEKDSFGLVAIASTGAILGVMLLGIFGKVGEFTGSADSDILQIQPFRDLVRTYFWESIMAVLPLFVILLVLQKISFRLSKREMRKLLTGFFFGFLGLFVFMLGVNGGFMNVGASIGNRLALMENKGYIIGIGLILGVATILAEPAVHVLTHQIEDVTSGYVKRKAVLFSLAVGVGLAVALSVIRILVSGVQLWHYLLPSYILCIGLMFLTPKLFVGIAFDAGGVATGPMTATFILAFIQGAAQAFEGANLLTDGFGMIAMVATMPIVTLQLLGLVFKMKAKEVEK